MTRTAQAMCLAALVGLSLWATTSPALARSGRPKGFRTTGLVRTTKDDGGRLTTVKIHDDRGALYHVTLDKKGLELGAEMHGEKTRATGVVSKKGDETWLTVRAYSGLEMAATHEQWRRMRCNYCVVGPALVNATIPRDLQGAKPIDGRPFSFKRQIVAWTRDERHLWVATDNELFQIGLAGKRLAKSYRRKDGLPDQVIYQLLSDGKTVWAVHRAGVAALTIGQAKIADLPALKCNFARLLAGEGCVWVIADTGTFRLKSAADKPVKKPALPTAERITKNVVNGIWLPHWQRRTAHFLKTPVSVGGRVYVSSYGDIYELDGGKWSPVEKNASDLRAGAGRLWFLCSKGLGEYDAATKKKSYHSAPNIPEGTCKQLLVTDAAVWVAVEPRRAPQDFVGGGLARLDLGSRKWQVWPEIHGKKVDRVTCLEEADGAVWAASLTGEYKKKGAHPGMTYVKRTVFAAAGFALHRFMAKEDKWETVTIGLPTFEKRLIIGQDGSRKHDLIVPQTVEDVSIGPARVFAVMRLFPTAYFCGYYPSVEQLAVRNPNSPTWTARFEHRPEDLGLQGEQPRVLNISNTGRMVLEGVGHDNVLEVFLHEKEHWAVTEGRVSCFDAAAGRWKTVFEPGFRFYWRPTAALDNGRALYVGSDRGLVACLDFETGRFELLTCLDQRSISRIAEDDAGNIFVASQPSPLGILPVQLWRKLQAEDWAVARFDGKTWARSDAQAMPRGAKPPWFVKRIKKRHRMDKSRGNCLFGPTPQGPKPRLYVKGVFYPKFLCASPDGDRLWLSTYSGLLCLDGVKKLLGPEN